MIDIRVFQIIVVNVQTRKSMLGHPNIHAAFGHNWSSSRVIFSMKRNHTPVVPEKSSFQTCSSSLKLIIEKSAIVRILSSEAALLVLMQPTLRLPWHLAAAMLPASAAASSL